MMNTRVSREMIPVVGVALLAVVAVGCGVGGGDTGSVGSTEPASAAIQKAEPEPVAQSAVNSVNFEGAWLLEDLAGRGVVDMTQTTVVFDSDGRVSGSGGCNRFTGSYTLENGRLAVGPLAGTKMMCPEAIMNQEDGFMQALGSAGRVEMDGATLSISIEGAEAPLKFTRMELDVID